MASKNFRPVFVWAFFVFVLSAIPGGAFPKIENFWDWLSPDKIVHFVFYGMLSYLLLRGFMKQFSLKSFNWIFTGLCLLIGIVFGGLIEVLQYFVFIGRSGNVYDFAANVLGCLIGTAIFWGINRKIMVE